ncbi:UDP-N-acetylmuramoyl-L-alanine--D-glutamate ligase [Desulfocicer vacuolatum]|nr:UDP-N-acetylmuramoyl-L-alanine--D-glutamate ligase [Desulfocicer vacuolatum]
MSHPYILVVGLGKSGIAMARFLKKRGNSVVITDSDPNMKKKAKALEKMGITTEIGPHNATTFDRARMIIASPGIPLDMPHLKRAAQRKIPIRGELDVAAEQIKVPVVAVTGTNGKTTVTTLIDLLLKSSHTAVFTGGNIGVPLTRYFDEDVPATVVVAEVSSFQLDTAMAFKPHVAVLLNITPDHMDRYSSFAAYAGSKWSIFAHQDKNDVAILGSSLSTYKKEIQALKATPFFIRPAHETPPENGAHIQEKSIRFYTRGKQMAGKLLISKIRIKGKHNLENIAASALAALCMGTPMADIEQIVYHFPGLEHRMEFSGYVNGIPYYNDSKATNPDAVIKAVSCFKNLILIMGGKEKNTDFSSLKSSVTSRVKHLILMGEAANNIQKALRGSCDITQVGTMASAVALARTLARKNDTVMLSPACASFDMYSSYGHRGDDFKHQIKQLTMP